MRLAGLLSIPVLSSTTRSHQTVSLQSLDVHQRGLHLAGHHVTLDDIKEHVVLGSDIHRYVKFNTPSNLS